MIYSEASNTVTFELRNSGGTVIDDTTLSVTSGQQRVDLNFEVPIGTSMQLGVTPGALTNIGLYRNNSGPNYPYDIGSAINITSSSAGSSPLGYYYFYYDIEVETPCDGVASPSWDCDSQGNCYDPGTGNGQYSSLTSCQASCIAPSFDCDGQGNCYDPGTGNGQYSTLSSCQNNCTVISSWDCALGNCYDPGTGNGQFSTLSACQSACVLPSWDCDGLGNCYDPGTGNGQYSSLTACQFNCVVPSWDCTQGNCYDPGTGNGQFSSLTSCQSNCIIPSFDCDGQGNCYDPGTGNGQYSNITACELNCVVPSWDCDGGICFDPGNGQGIYSSLLDCEYSCTNVSIEDFDLAGLRIYPNPSEDIFNIEFISSSFQNLEVRVVNVLGEKIFTDNLNQFKGKYTQQFNLSNYSSGVYLLEIKTNQGVINKKLILQ